MSDKSKGIEEGPKIWVESLMTNEEWKVRLKTYPTSHLKEKPQFFKSDYEWRWQMGAGLTPEQIQIVSKNLDKLRDYRLKLKAEELLKEAELLMKG